jgi:fructokinase
LSRGSAGSTWFTANDQRDVPTHAVPAVDTTGAGDGFMAGLIAGVLADPAAVTDADKLDRICGFANAVGALTTLERGAIPALPTRAAVERFLESR